MEEKVVKNNKKVFAIFYCVNGHKTIIYKLKSTNGKQALQTFIRHYWNGLRYDIRKADAMDRHEIIDMLLVWLQVANPDWVAVKKGFATLISEELL